MKYIIVLLISIWNFVFKRDLNLFDVFIFSMIWERHLGVTDGMFWAILIPGIFLSALGSSINKQIQEKVYEDE